MIYVLHGCYLPDAYTGLEKDCRLQDMNTVQYLRRVAENFPGSLHFMSVYFDISSDTAGLKDFLGSLQPSDVLVIGSLQDLSPMPDAALGLLDALTGRIPDCPVYILSISFRKNYLSYRDQLIKALPKPSPAPAARESKYSWALKEYAATKRLTYPQVSFEDLTRYTGIPYRSILYHLKSTRGYIPERRPSRPITQEEIDEIRRIMSDNI